MRVGSEQPFLFYPEGFDVRWRSFAAVAEQAEGGRRALEELLPCQVGGAASAGPTVVAYAWAGGMAGGDGVAADLAIRSGGWTAAPVPVPSDAASPVGSAGPLPVRPPRHEARLLLPWEADSAAPSAANAPAGAERGAAVARLPAAVRELDRRPRPDGAGDLPPRSGAVLIRETAAGPEGPQAEAGATEGEWRVVGPETLRDAAEELARALDPVATPGEAAAPGPQAGRPVVAAWLDPSLAEGRVLLEWAVMARVALYLEPERRVLGGAAAWVRPTVVAGDAGALAAVAGEVRRQEARRGRLLRRLGRSAPHPPFGRLRWAVLLGAEGLSDEDRTLFDRRGVSLVRPALGTARVLKPS